MARLTAALLVLLSLVATSIAQAREEILHFESLLEVQQDGSIIVTENITVRAEGRKIKRGIYRDIPVNYIGALGDRRSAGFELLDVDSDVTGRSHFTKDMGEDIRIYMGERNRRLQPGVYRYTFRYSMQHQIGYFDDYDEIYWNVTGNRWDFPINQVTSRVVLPDGAKILQSAAYTGRRGDTGKDYQFTRIADNIAEFTTTRQLPPRQEITVAVGWPKGLVAEPSTTERTLSWLFGNSGLLALFASAVAVPWFLFRSWLRIGRDPEKGVIIPLFAPPDGLSPAAVSYVHYMGLKSAGRGASKALIAALVSLAVKGRIRLDEGEERITAEMIDHRGDDLPAGELALRNAMFGGTKRFMFSESNASKFALARQKFRKALIKEHSDKHFKDNAGYSWFGIGLAVAGIAAFFILQRPPEEQVGPFIGIGVVSVVLAVLATIGWHQFQQRGFGRYVVMIVAVMFLGGFGKVLSEADSLGFNPAVVVPGAAFLVMVVSVVVFGQLLRAPTVPGRRTMDQIEGLRLYLSVAEAERMNMEKAPDMSTQLFERLLPFAIALDVEEPWSNAFASHMARLLPEQRSDYRPNWYSGRSWDSNNIGRATEGMMSAMSDSMAAATPASSGSGSGGGGSAGGGGGGGGGGGW